MKISAYQPLPFNRKNRKPLPPPLFFLNFENSKHFNIIQGNHQTFEAIPSSPEPLLVQVYHVLLMF